MEGRLVHTLALVETVGVGALQAGIQVQPGAAPVPGKLAQPRQEMNALFFYMEMASETEGVLNITYL